MESFNSKQNYGYGRDMTYAGKRALKHRYADGRYAGGATYSARLRQICGWMKQQDVDNVIGITQDLLELYAQQLAWRIKQKKVKAVNLLSTANAVFEALRGDKTVRVSPTSLLGKRCTKRTKPPADLDLSGVYSVADIMHPNGFAREASVIELARTFGVRLKEACLLSNHNALKQAQKLDRIDIRHGTKGGEENMWSDGSQHLKRHTLSFSVPP